MAFMVGRFAGTFFMRFIKPAKLLAVYALINILLCGVAMYAHGLVAVYAVICIAFFMSVMFPTIFSLGIQDLGPDAKFGSSLIIMAIVGGAIMPPIMAQISDVTGNIQMGYIIPLICFAVVFLFGWKGYQLKNG
jgi:FHS family L-fucose permease-like MFS transporter